MITLNTQQRLILTNSGSTIELKIQSSLLLTKIGDLLLGNKIHRKKLTESWYLRLIDIDHRRFRHEIETQKLLLNR